MAMPTMATMATMATNATNATNVNELSLEYSFSELQQATHHFHENMRLGYGSFGGVFRGIQKDGTEVAIKVLDVGDEGGFEDEVRVLSKFRHPNLVILMGYAKNGLSRFLVYEHLGGGDVFRRLQRCTTENVPFTWRERISVGFDASCGLSHLHNSTPKVFHRDIKCPNILLDRNGTAKIADFGLACRSNHREKELKVNQAAGTVGYACPHYVNKGVVTEGSEVYSFGIVLLELLTAAQPAYMAQAADGSQQYHFLVTRIGNDVRVATQMADQKARFPPDVAADFAALGLRCTEYQEEYRPFFTEIVTVLRGLRAATEAPQPPRAPQQPLREHARLGYAELGAPAPGAPGAPAPGAALVAGLPGLPGLPGPGPPAPAPAAPAEEWLDEQRRLAAATNAANNATNAANAANLANLAVQRQASMHERFPGGALQIQTANSAQVGAATGPSSPISVMQPVPMRLFQQPPLLWTLQCVMSECADISAKPQEQRTLAHRREGQAMPTQRFGRLFQQDFCRLLLPDDLLHSQVSREHFQIWAEEWPVIEGINVQGLPCSFFLTNYGTVGTTVDGVVLDTRGQQAALHDGSKIALLRRATDEHGVERKTNFLEFLFSLEGSDLVDADALYQSLPASRRSCEAPSPGSSQGVGLPAEAERCGDAVQGGVSFAGADVEPVFILELGGTALRSGVPRENFRVLHGPRASAIASAPSCEAPCPPLVLGSGLQRGFWNKILTDEARHLLTEKHLQLEVDESLEGPEQRRFFLRNLSELSLRVEGAPEGHDSTRPPDEDGRWQLHHGDTVLLNLAKGSSMWMCFREFAGNQPAKAPRSEPELSAPRASGLGVPAFRRSP